MNSISVMPSNRKGKMAVRLRSSENRAASSQALEATATTAPVAPLLASVAVLELAFLVLLTALTDVTSLRLMVALSG